MHAAGKPGWLALLLVAGSAFAAPDDPSALLSQALRQGDYAALQNATQKTVLDSFARAPKYVPTQRFEAVLNDEPALLALAQVRFIQRVSPAVLKDFAGTPAKQELLKWLLANRAALEDFCTTIKPDEEAAIVLAQWGDLWQADPKTREKYYRLALACAVVFDRPVPVVPQLAYANLDLLERYKYFRDSAEAGSLCAPIAEMAPFELVWVVDAPVPNSELEWARRNARYPRPQWSSAYSAITYRMEKAMRGVDTYKSYTLAEIRAKGGICTDQAHYAAISAKANGVPAMIIHGTGQRGAHAWFGYKASAQEWNLKAGRYDDNYATGYTTDPQTGAQIKEQELYLLADPQRRHISYEQATRLLWLSQLLATTNQGPAAREALELAINTCSRHLPAWNALMAELQQTKAQRTVWEKHLAAMRSNFRAYPDVVSQINRLEIEFLKATSTPEQAAEALRAQQRRLKDRYEDRTDLLLDTIAQRVSLLEAKSDLDGAEKIFRTALHEEGRNLVVWQSLAERFYAFGERHNRRHQTVRRLFDSLRSFPPPDEDPFALRAYAGLERQVAGYLDKDGQKSQAKALRAQAENRERRAANAR